MARVSSDQAKLYGVTYAGEVSSVGEVLSRRSIDCLGSSSDGLDGGRLLCDGNWLASHTKRGSDRSDGYLDSHRRCKCGDRAGSLGDNGGDGAEGSDCDCVLLSLLDVGTGRGGSGGSQREVGVRAAVGREDLIER